MKTGYSELKPGKRSWRVAVRNAVDVHQSKRIFVYMNSDDSPEIDGKWVTVGENWRPTSELEDDMYDDPSV
jgi:hypothetical protein